MVRDLPDRDVQPSKLISPSQRLSWEPLAARLARHVPIVRAEEHSDDVAQRQRERGHDQAHARASDQPQQQPVPLRPVEAQQPAQARRLALRARRP